jgi:hypothetical protein
MSRNQLNITCSLLMSPASIIWNWDIGVCILWCGPETWHWVCNMNILTTLWGTEAYEVLDCVWEFLHHSKKMTQIWRIAVTSKGLQLVPRLLRICLELGGNLSKSLWCWFLDLLCLVLLNMRSLATPNVQGDANTSVIAGQIPKLPPRASSSLS